MTHFDIVIAGGGMVGATVANLLAKGGLDVLVVERFDPRRLTFAEQPFLRTSALNRFAIEQLQQIGAWTHIDEGRKAPYVGLQTWERGHHPLAFDAADAGVDYLGHILENNLVQWALWQCFDEHKVQLRTPAAIQRFSNTPEGVEIELDSGEHLTARLLVAADGANSKIRQMAGLGIDGWDYAQHCLAINVLMDVPQPPVTWQEFHPSGPRAYLPLFDQYASLIWYDDAQKIARLKSLSDDALSAEIKAAFPSRLGNFELLEKGSFALTRRHASQYYKERVVLVGDAAHTINPLAGQGVNLGFKDAHKLAECVLEAVEKGEPYWGSPTLKKYHQARYKQNLLMMSAMDAFYLTFSNDMKPLSLLRNLGLRVADKAGPMKNQVLRYAMGI